MKALILDDDDVAVERLRSFLEGELELIGAVGTIDEAKPIIEQQQPELIFLEAKLRSGNGLKLIDFYGQDVPFNFIIVSKSEDYAIDAYQRFAVDYLTKPVDEVLLLKAISKFNKRKKKVESSINAKQLRLSDKIALPTQDGFIFVKRPDIIRCEAHGNYTQVFLNDGRKLMITKTLKHYEEALEGGHFFRAHKSHLINLQYVRKFIKGKQSYIETTDGISIEVSTRKREALLQRLSFTEQ